MSAFEQLPAELSELGDVLCAAIADNLSQTATATATPPGPALAAAGGVRTARGTARSGRARGARLRRLARSATSTRRRIAVTVAVAVVAVPGAAIAADALLSPDQVASSLSSGTLALLGTHPSCTTVQDGVEYHCVLESVPTNQGGPPANQWLNTVEPSVGADQHVNGGCRAQNQAGTEWECYLGEAAVTQKIIGQGFLGAYAPGPGVG
jgi:hypothetical protein